MSIGPESHQKPQCVVCSEVLANASMKPSKLMRHLRTKHTDAKKKPIEYFQRKRDELRNKKTLFVKRTKLSSVALKAAELNFDCRSRIDSLVKNMNLILRTKVTLNCWND